jgi:2'-5' RNA ligase
VPPEFVAVGDESAVPRGTPPPVVSDEPLTGTVAERAAAMRAENPAIDREAAAMAERAREARAVVPEPVPEPLGTEEPAALPPVIPIGEKPEGVSHKFSSTQLNLPPEVAKEVEGLARFIPEEDLAEGGRETEPHVTVKYGLTTNDPAEVARVLADQPPITVTMGRTSHFANVEDGTADAVKVDVDGPELRALNKRIAEAVDTPGDTHKDYKPHATIAYVKPGLGTKYDGDTTLEGTQVVIDRLVFSGKDGQKYEIPLGGQANAIKTGQITENDQPERVEAPPRRQAPEAGRGDSDADSGQAEAVQPEAVARDVDQSAPVKRGEVNRQQAFFLRWMADDLRAVPWQKGGSTPEQRAAAREASDPGDTSAKANAARNGFVPAPHIAGAPLYHALRTLGTYDSRPMMARAIDRYLSGETDKPPATVRAAMTLIPFLERAWNPQRQRFDYNRIPDEMIEAFNEGKPKHKRLTAQTFRQFVTAPPEDQPAALRAPFVQRAPDEQRDMRRRFIERRRGRRDERATAFDPAELEQVATQGDVNEFGEEQPRLPGAGEVRDTEVATPEIADVPFSLVAEAEDREGYTPPLTESQPEEKPERWSANALARVFNLGENVATMVDTVVRSMGLDTSKIRITRGGTSAPGALAQFGKNAEQTIRDEFPQVDFSLFDRSNSYSGEVWYLNVIAIEKADRNKGLGTAVMERLIELADRDGATLALTPASDFGSSLPRLKKFYRRFGFTPNAGRRADNAITGAMIRRPKKLSPAAVATDQTKTKAFKDWFGKSKVVDAKGKPLVVYHGTTQDFTAFESERGNVESDFGAGIYFSSNPKDVGENYAGIGPDLEAKIERAYEQLESQVDYDPDKAVEVDEYQFEHGIEERDEAMRRMVRERFVTHEGLTMPVFLKVENPAIVGGKGETTLTYEQAYDDENDEYGEEQGTLVDFIVNLRNVASRYDDGDVESVVESLVNDSLEFDGGLPLSRVQEILKSDEQFQYFTDPDRGGDIISNEIFREALEATGFDGIIDRTVDVKFGSQRRIGKSMAGMTPDTVHYIVFDPTQIKSAVGNRGTFDSRNPNILEQRPQITYQGDSRISRLLQSAWHGSPHIFDQFSLQKIGTGEGAQAYGWGLYFASNKKVAEFYRNQLAHQRILVDGKPVRATSDTGRGLALIHLSNKSASPKTTEYVRRGFLPSYADEYEAAIAEFAGRVTLDKQGRLYKVEIPDDGDYLDWDKPLSEQPQAVRDALANEGVEGDYVVVSVIGFDNDGNFSQNDRYIFHSKRVAQKFADSWKTKGDYEVKIYDDYDEDYIRRSGGVLTGKDAYRELGDPEEASRKLAALGVPGIRYLDGSSRDKGEGNYNYVVFDDRLVKIMEFEQGPKASVEFFGDSEALIRAFETADVSSALHEVAHVARRFLLNRDVPAENRRGVSDSDIDTIERWAGATDGQWTVEAEEKFARGFERYVREGGGTLPKNLRDIFQKLAQWMADIYARIQGSDIDIDLPPAIREVMDRLVTREQRLREASVKTTEVKAETPVGEERPHRDDGTFQTNAEVNGFEKVIDALTDIEKAATKRLRTRRAPKTLKQEPKKQTDTVAFRRWFGESKVVDADGNPLLMYHGTNEAIERFSRDKVVAGFHFGTTAQANMRVAGKGQNLVPVYLSIANPRRSKDTGGNWASKIKAAKADGYDGIVYLNRYEGIPLESFQRAGQKNLDALSDSAFKRLIPEAADSYIAFSPTQIKSAIGNQGTFDPRDPDILKQEPGQPPQPKAAPLPFDDATDYAIIGAAKIARGAVSLERFTTEMIGQFGEDLRPHIDSIWQQATSRAAQLQKFDPDDYFNFRRVSLSDAEKDALRRQVIETIVTTGRVPKERVTFDEIRAEAQSLHPDAVKHLAAFQQAQAPYRAVRDAARHRINVLNREIIEDTKQLEKDHSTLTPEELIVREKAIAEKETDVRSLLDTWMRMRSEDGRNLAMHRMVSDSTENWQDHTYWMTKAKRMSGLPPGTQLPTHILRDLRKLLERGHQAVVEGKPVEPIQQELALYMMRMQRTALLDVISTVRRAGLLTGLKTIGRNIIGNTLFQVMEELARIPAVIVDFIISQFGQRSRTVQAVNPAAVWRSAREGATRGVAEATQVIEQGATAEDLRTAEARQEMNSGIKWLDFYANGIFRVHSSTDRIFKSYAYRRSLEEQAALEAINRGVSPIELLAQPTEEMKAEANAAALFATFNNPNKIAQNFRSMQESLKRSDKDVDGVKEVGGKALAFGLDLLVPYANTPANITTRTLDYGVIGSGARLIKVAFDGIVKRGLTPLQQRTVAMAIGRGLVGSSLLYLGWQLSAAGLMTGDAGEDERGDRPLNTAAGRIAGAVLVGGKWMALGSLGPAGILMVVGATMQQLSRKDFGSEIKQVGKQAATVTRIITEMPMLQGVSEFMDALKNPASAGETWLTNMMGSFVPTFSADLASLFDPYRRDARPDGIADSLWIGAANRLPGLRNILPRRTDVFGRDIEQESMAIWNPMLGSTAKEFSEPMLRELVAHRVGVGFPRPDPGESIDAYRERSRALGKAIAERLTSTINGPLYQDATPERKAELLDNAVNRARTQFRRQQRQAQ